MPPVFLKLLRLKDNKRARLNRNRKPFKMLPVAPRAGATLLDFVWEVGSDVLVRFQSPQESLLRAVGKPGHT